MVQMEIGIQGRTLVDRAKLTERVQRNQGTPPTPATPVVTEMLNAFLVEHYLTEPEQSWTGEDADDLVDLASHGYQNHDRVIIYNLSGGSNLIDGKTYYVITRQDDTFQLAAYPGGDAVSFGNNVTAAKVAKWLPHDSDRINVYMKTSSPVTISQANKITEFSVNIPHSLGAQDLTAGNPQTSFPVYDAADRYLAVTVVNQDGVESAISATVGPFNADDGAVTLGSTDSVIKSANYDGTWDASGLKFDGTTGWALDWSGKMEAEEAHLRGTIVAESGELQNLDIKGTLKFGTSGYLITSTSTRYVMITSTGRDAIYFGMPGLAAGSSRLGWIGLDTISGGIQGRLEIANAENAQRNMSMVRLDSTQIIFRLSTVGNAGLSNKMTLESTKLTVVPRLAINDSITVNQGGLTVSSGNVAVTKGDLTLSSGDINITKGDVNLTDGNITLTTGYFHSAEHGNAASPRFTVQAANHGMYWSTGDAGLAWAVGGNQQLYLKAAPNPLYIKTGSSFKQVKSRLSSNWTVAGGGNLTSDQGWIYYSTV